ncbi:hypothetical protein [Blastococcus sp. CCUG 61487]|uniref:hypothetical protein n=1 Tax=Blastococcus sp. CCUG 61487 TaxID=1840703 RepID=UPI0010C1010A|nr:hypothetical protein [Blastococcus sp. CCUG 61487]TKJ17958.1 hypothetical protein A6V29_01045 [Blastococcus sp. CCUG 61487]
MDEAPRWDAARVALADLGRLMTRDPETDPEKLGAQVEYYDQIPEPVREQLRSLTPDQRRALMATMRVLVENHFYFEDPGGQQEFL